MLIVYPDKRKSKNIIIVCITHSKFACATAIIGTSNSCKQKKNGRLIGIVCAALSYKRSCAVLNELFCLQHFRMCLGNSPCYMLMSLCVKEVSNAGKNSKVKNVMCFRRKI